METSSLAIRPAGSLFDRLLVFCWCVGLGTLLLVALAALGYFTVALPLERNEAAISFCSMRVCGPSMRAAAELRDQLDWPAPSAPPPDELLLELPKHHDLLRAWGTFPGPSAAEHREPAGDSAGDGPVRIVQSGTLGARSRQRDLEACADALDFLRRERGAFSFGVQILAYNPTRIAIAVLSSSFTVVPPGASWSFLPGANTTDSLSRGALVACDGPPDHVLPPRAWAALELRCQASTTATDVPRLLSVFASTGRVEVGLIGHGRALPAVLLPLANRGYFRPAHIWQRVVQAFGEERRGGDIVGGGGAEGGREHGGLEEEGLAQGRPAAPANAQTGGAAASTAEAVAQAEAPGASAAGAAAQGRGAAGAVGGSPPDWAPEVAAARLGRRLVGSGLWRRTAVSHDGLENGSHYHLFDNGSHYHLFENGSHYHLFDNGSHYHPSPTAGAEGVESLPHELGEGGGGHGGACGSGGDNATHRRCNTKLVLGLQTRAAFTSWLDGVASFGCLLRSNCKLDGSQPWSRDTGGGDVGAAQSAPGATDDGGGAKNLNESAPSGIDEAVTPPSSRALKLLPAAERAHGCVRTDELQALLNVSGVRVGDYELLNPSAALLGLLSHTAACMLYSHELWDPAGVFTTEVQEDWSAAAHDLHAGGQAVTGHLHTLAGFIARTPHAPSPPSPPPATPPPPPPSPPPSPPPPSPTQPPPPPPSPWLPSLYPVAHDLFSFLSQFRHPVGQGQPSSPITAPHPFEVGAQDLLLTMLPTGCTSEGLLTQELGATMQLRIHNPSAFRVNVGARTHALIRQPDESLVGRATLIEAVDLLPHSDVTALVLIDFRYVIARLGLDLDLVRRPSEEGNAAGRFGASHAPAIIASVTGMLLHVDATVHTTVLGLNLTVQLPRVGYFRINPPPAPSSPPAA